MATFYVRSTDGNDADDGSTWALAKATLAGAFAAAAAGDRIYVSQAHAETQASPITLTSPGTAASPVEVVCGNDAAEPPTALATSATVTTTGTNNITFAGFCYVYGITFSAGTSGTGTSINFTSTSPWWFKFEASRLALGSGTGTSSSRIVVGTSANTGDDQLLELVNTTVKFANVAQAIRPFARMIWRDTANAVDTAGSIPTSLFVPISGPSAIVDVHAVDLSALGSGKSLVTVGTGFSSFEFLNCKLGSSVAALSGTIAGQGGERVSLINCDSGDTNYRSEFYQPAASVVPETTKVMTGGASDGTTGLAWNLTTLSAGNKFYSPVRSPKMAVWNEATGSSITVTVEILHDSATALKDNEVWLEVGYQGTSGFPLGLRATDRATNLFSAGANQDSSSVTWTTTGLTNPNKQKLEVTFTPQEKGWITADVCVAKASYTIYINPELVISGFTSGRQMQMPGGNIYINEGSSGGGGLAANPVRGFVA